MVFHSKGQLYQYISTSVPLQLVWHEGWINHLKSTDSVQRTFYTYSYYQEWSHGHSRTMEHRTCIWEGTWGPPARGWLLPAAGSWWSGRAPCVLSEPHRTDSGRSGSLQNRKWNEGQFTYGNLIVYERSNHNSCKKNVLMRYYVSWLALSTKAHIYTVRVTKHKTYCTRSNS